MIAYSNAGAIYAVLQCIEKSNYKFVIACSSGRAIKEVFDVCMKIIEKLGLDKPQCRVSSYNGLITFKNGSTIDIIPANNSARGKAANIVMYEAGVSDEIRDKVLRHIEKIKEV